jgi:hypothetical protein
MNARTSVLLRFVWGSILAALFLVLVGFPSKPLGVDLDSSWSAVFVKLTARGYRPGHDLVYAYGPLGYLFNAVQTDVLFWPRYFFEISSKLLLACLLVESARRLNFVLAAAFLAWMFCFLPLFQDSIIALLVFALGSHLLGDAWSDRKICLGGGYLAFLALVKHSFLLQSFLTIGCAFIFLLNAGRRKTAVRLVIFYVAILFGLWFGLHYQLWELGYFWKCSMQISGGYQDTMFTPWKPGAFLWSLSLWAGLSVLALNLVWNKRREKGCWKPAMILVFCFFLTWKHAAIRSETHALGWFVFAPAAGAYLAFLPFRRPLSFITQGLVILLGIFGLGGLHTQIGPHLHEKAFSFPEKILLHSHQLFHPLETKREFAQSWNDSGQNYRIPRFSARIGTGTVDFFGYEQGLILANDWNYTPRPVFQSFVGFTPFLANLNRKFFARSSAPDWVIMKLQSLEGRVPTLDDAGSLESILRGYQPVDVSEDYLLWKKISPSLLLPKKSKLSSQSVAENEPVVVPETQGSLYVSFDFKPTWAERLVSILHKPHEIKLEVEMENGGNLLFRLPREEAREPFLVSPSLWTMPLIYDLILGENPPKIRRLKWRMDGVPHFKAISSAQITFWESEPLSLATKKDSLFKETTELDRRLRASLFPGFSAVPDRFEAIEKPRVLTENNHRVVFMHAPSEMAWDQASGGRQISGKFGIFAGAYTGEVKTDGVLFEVFVESKGRQAPLFSRYLDPAVVPGDRGVQTFQAVLPPGTWTLHTRTTTGPRQDGKCDWSYWSDIVLSP